MIFVGGLPELWNAIQSKEVRFSFLLIKTSMEAVNPKMEMVTYILGASPFKIFVTILLPLCKRGIISAIILTWSRAMGEFGATLMLVGVTHFKTETLPGSIYLSISTGNNSRAMAIATIMIMVSAMTITLIKRVNNRNTDW